MTKTHLNILFLYNVNWDKEIADYRTGSVPAHRLFGYADLENLGHRSLSCPWPGGIRRGPYNPLIWRVYQACHALVRQKQIDCVVATHEAAAIPLLALKRLKLVHKPVIVLNVGLLHWKNTTGSKRWLWRWLLPAADAVISYASSQIDGLAETFALRRDKQFFVPFGVDTSFFSADAGIEVEDFCLSVGTNEGKDFSTLVRALPADMPFLAVTDSMNEEIIRGTASPDFPVTIKQNVPIKLLKTLYQKARVHVIPLADVPFSAGQTTLLENMALGKVMIVSDILAIRDYVEDGKTAVCVRPGDIQNLHEKICDVWQHPRKYSDIGQSAAREVKNEFSSVRFGERLVDVIRHFS